MASPLDCDRKRALMPGAGAGLPPWSDLSPFHDESAQEIRLLVVHAGHLVDAELANPWPTDVRATWPALKAARTLSTARAFL
jgi:hypothetical protein